MRITPPIGTAAPPATPAPAGVAVPSPLPTPGEAASLGSSLIPIGSYGPVPTTTATPDPPISRSAPKPSDPGAERRTSAPPARPTGDLAPSPTAPRAVTPPTPAPPIPPTPVEAAPSTAGQLTGAPDLIAAPTLSETLDATRKAESPGPKKARSRLRWPTLVFPLLFLLLSGIVVYLVLDISGIFTTARVTPKKTFRTHPTPNQGARENAELDGNPKLISTGPRPSPIITPRQPNSSRLDPVSETIPEVDNRDLTVDGEVPPTPSIDLDAFDTEPEPEPFDPANPSSVLEKFLEAKTLEERLPFITKSKRSDGELAESCLAKPFPEVINRRSVHYMENRSDRHKEHFFEVFFQMDPAERAVPILVQLNDWGDGEIRVHPDAFIDLFDDRLGAYGEHPVKESATFHVVADAYKHCFDEIIPDWDKKSFLKLRTHPRMAPRLIAYFNRRSELAKEISQPDALPWGESGICTVTVRWNTDLPDRPFVELVKMEGFTWNP